MSDVNENLLTAAKLREQIDGRLESKADFHSHTGLVDDDVHHRSLSFVESTLAESNEVRSWRESELGKQVVDTFRSERATRAVTEGNAEVLSHLVGVTEQDLDASALTLPIRLLDELDNNGAPAFLIGVGNPNTGKTNSMLLLAELRKADLDDLLVLTNFDSSLTDHRVTGAHDLAVTLLENRNVPKFVIVDESSTHFDSRTYRREVAVQWTPLAKRFAKVGVDAAGLIGHTGKDLHPESKRMATLPYFKSEKKNIEFFANWPADEDHPTDRKFGGSLDELQATTAEYHSDDAAPWSWDLEPDLFTLDLDWSELLAELKERGPADE